MMEQVLFRELCRPHRPSGLPIGTTFICQAYECCRFLFPETSGEWEEPNLFLLPSEILLLPKISCGMSHGIPWKFCFISPSLDWCIFFWPWFFSSSKFVSLSKDNWLSFHDSQDQWPGPVISNFLMVGLVLEPNDAAHQGKGYIGQPWLVE